MFCHLFLSQATQRVVEGMKVDVFRVFTHKNFVVTANYKNKATAQGAAKLIHHTQQHCYYSAYIFIFFLIITCLN